MSGPAPVLRAVAAHFGLGDVTDWAWVARGSMGEVYRLSCADRLVAAKRSFSDEIDESRMRGEIEFAAVCRREGVRSPMELVDPSGDPLFVDQQTGDRWRLQEWVDGGVASDDDMQTLLWLAEQIATIHRLALPAEADDYVAGWYCRVDDRWDTALALTEGVADPWASTLRRRAAEFRELGRLVDSVPMGALVRCHRDALPGNVMCGSDDRRWLIDWENSGAMEPWRELGVLLFRQARSPEVAGRIARRYRDSAGQQFPTGVELFSSGVAIWLNYLQGKAIEAADSALDPEHRAFAIVRVVGLVENIPSLADLEAAAAAIRLGLTTASNA